MMIKLWKKYKLYRKLKKARFIYFGDIKFDLENGCFHESKLDKAQGFEFVVEYTNRIRYFTKIWAEIYFTNKNNIVRYNCYLGKYYDLDSAMEKYNVFCNFLKNQYMQSLNQYQSLKYDYEIERFFKKRKTYS